MLLRIGFAKKWETPRCLKLHNNFRRLCKSKGYHELNIARVEKQLRTETLIIPPGVCDKNGNQFLYMKPGKFTPGTDDLDALLESLVYLLGHITSKEKASTDGIAFMANMSGWGWSNFGTRYAKSFFDLMQGSYPLRIRTFLIMNPPSWFGMVWRIIRPMMSKKFAEKVHIVSDDAIYEHVSKDHLPEEMGGGSDFGQLVDEFIAYATKLESEASAKEEASEE